MSRGSIMVTGANGGLGSAIATHLVQKSDLSSTLTGIYTVRKVASASTVQGVLKKAPASHRHEILDLDLGSLASVRETAAKINQRVEAGELPPIRALILNAGYQDHQEINMTEDGFETTWQINFLSNMLLVLLLLESMDKQNGRILIIGSWSHDINDERNNSMGNTPYQGHDTLFPGAEALAKGRWSRPEVEAGWYTGYRRYGASKLCATMFLLQVKYLVPVAACISAMLAPNGTLRPARKSAADAVRACFDVAAPPRGTALYLNGSEELETGAESRVEERRSELWRYSLAAAGIRQEDTVLENWQ